MTSQALKKPVKIPIVQFQICLRVKGNINIHFLIPENVRFCKSASVWDFVLPTNDTTLIKNNDQFTICFRAAQTFLHQEPESNSGGLGSENKIIH